MKKTQLLQSKHTQLVLELG